MKKSDHEALAMLPGLGAVPVEVAQSFQALASLVSALHANGSTLSDEVEAIFKWHLAEKAPRGRPRDRERALAVGSAALHYLEEHGRHSDYKVADAARWSLRGEVCVRRLRQLWASSSYQQMSVEERREAQAQVAAQPVEDDEIADGVSERARSISAWLRKQRT